CAQRRVQKHFVAVGPQVSRVSAYASRKDSTCRGPGKSGPRHVCSEVLATHHRPLLDTPDLLESGLIVDVPVIALPGRREVCLVDDLRWTPARVRGSDTVKRPIERIDRKPSAPAECCALSRNLVLTLADEVEILLSRVEANDLHVLPPERL